MATPDIQTLPDEYRRLLELAQERLQVELLLLEELKGGRTGALLYLVSLAPVPPKGTAPGVGGASPSTDSRQVVPPYTQPLRHLVLKLDHIPPRATSDEIAQHKQALDLAPPGFARQHIADLAHEVKDGEHVAIFYAIAGQSLLQFRPLVAYARQSQLETLFRTTHDVLLNRWNAQPSFERGVHAQKLLERWLSYRLKPGGRISDFLEHSCGIAAGTPGFVIRGEVYPNPLAFGRDPALWGKARPLDVLTGFQHGDLNTRNILARFAADGQELDGYFLIDFALFKSGMPLLFDPRYLEMSYLIAELEQAGLDPWVELVTGYAREDTPDPQQVPVTLAGACSVLNAGRAAFREWVEASHASLCDDLWAQFWLAGAAAGLNFCNKQVCQDRERLAGLIYAAAHLKRFCAQFGLCMSAEVKLLFDNARTWEAARLAEGTPAAPGLPAAPGPLPAQPFPEQVTPFVGRRREIAEVEELLGAARLVTLHGQGGIGKTRLALTIAAEQRARYRDGAYFVSLLSHDSPSAIVPAIAGALGVTFKEGRSPQDQLLDALRSRRILLVLDNLEHLLREERAPATLALVEALQAAAPELTILVTSRELLRLPQEQAYTVEGLPVSGTATYAPETAVPSDEGAVELFRLRARRVQPTNPLDTAEDLRLIRALCQAVAGMPLAIELAAAQLRLLSLGDITARIESSLDVLETGLRGTAARHRSMRAVFETSWDGLEPAERFLFARLSVFHGSFSMEAAEQAAGAGVRDLAGLVDKSLISRTADGRFTLHPLVQRFAGHKLAGLPEERTATRQRHFEYYKMLATQADGEWEATRQRTALETLRPDVDNVLAAWNWALEQRDWSAISEVTDALWTFHRVQGRLTEAMELVAKAISEGSGAEPGSGPDRLAHWEGLLGDGHHWLSEVDEGTKHYQRALAALGWPVPQRRIHTTLSLAGQLVLQGLHRLAPRLFVGRLAHRRAAIDEAVVAYHNLQLWAAMYNQELVAVYCAIRNLNLAEAGGRPSWMASTYAGAAYLCLFAAARPIAEFYARKAEASAARECIDLARTSMAFVLGWYYFCVGEHHPARLHFEESANAAGRLEQGWNQGNALVGLLYQAYQLGDYRRCLEYAAQVRESGQRRGDLGFVGAANYWDAVVKLQWGRLEEAKAHLEQSAATPTAAMKPFDWTIVWGAQTRIYLRQGRLDLAVREADQVTRMVDEAGSITTPMAIYALAGAAEAYVAAWEAACPRSRSRASGSGGAQRQPSDPSRRQAAEKACRNLEKAAHAFPYGRTTARLYRGCFEWLSGRPHEAHRAWTESLAAARELDFPYEEGLAHYEIGRHLTEGEAGIWGLGERSKGESPTPLIPAHWGRREHLERAAEIFARLEIPCELNLVRAAQRTGRD